MKIVNKKIFLKKRKKITSILVIGQCTLHWGRLEYGNIGNYYVIASLFAELRRVFPTQDICTTFQVTDAFAEKYNLRILPMSSYYGWSIIDVPKSLIELCVAKLHSYGLNLPMTRFSREVLSSDVVIDYSGDIWGDNAELVGKRRFMIGIIKDRVAQLLKKPVALLAGSPGPFTDRHTLGYAKYVFSKFSLVTNREPISRRLLLDWGFDCSKTYDCACPAFLFEPAGKDIVDKAFAREGVDAIERPLIGMIVCGWNMIEGPYDKWPRRDDEYKLFVNAVEYMINSMGAHVYLMSHSNGFVRHPEFKSVHGRDYLDATRIYELCVKEEWAHHVTLQKNVHPPEVQKGLIGRMSMLVTGRIHAAVASLSQHIPTVIIDYGHEPKAHKLMGFAEIAGVIEHVVDPAVPNKLIDAIQHCWQVRDAYAFELERNMPEVRNLARMNTDLLLTIS